MTNRKAKTFTLNDITKSDLPEIIDIRLSPAGLREVVLKIGPRTIVVSEADSMVDYRISKMVTQIVENPNPDKLIQGILTNLYPPLYACSSGDVPTPDEFLGMSKAGQELWIETARRLNPHEEIAGVSWWGFIDEIYNEVAKITTEEDIEKKGNG